MEWDDDKRESPDEEADTLHEDDEPDKTLKARTTGTASCSMQFGFWDNQRMLAQVIDYYQDPLKENTDGLRYL